MVIVVVMDGKIVGIIVIVDMIKKGVREVIEDFYRMGKKVGMIMGDNRRMVEVIGKVFGVDYILVEVFLGDKVNEVKKF